MEHTVATQSSDVTSNNFDTAYPTQSVSTEAKSIVSIIKQDNANSGSVWAFVSGSEYDGTLTTNEGGNTDFAYGGTTETSSFTSPFSNSTSSVVTAIWGGEYSKLYKDGTLLTSSQNNTTLSSSAYLALGTSFVENKTPWYPTSIPSCSLWLDANDASSMTVSGTNISEWRNKSTEFAGYFDLKQSNASNQPTYVTGVINNKSVVRLDGTGSFMNSSGSTVYRSPAGSNDDVTIFYVFKYFPNVSPHGANYDKVLLAWNLDSDYDYNSTYSVRVATDANRPTWGTNYGIGAEFRHSGPTGLLILENIHWTTSPLVYSAKNVTSGIRITGSGEHTYVLNTGLLGDNTFPSNDSYIYQRMGVTADNLLSANEYVNGDVAEIICYARHLSSDEMAKVETYLQNKWNITVATQSSDIDTDNTLTGSVSTYWSGSIGEMLVYNKAISDKERRRAENYLQQKWRTSGSSGTGNGNGGGGGGGGGYP